MSSKISCNDLQKRRLGQACEWRVIQPQPDFWGFGERIGGNSLFDVHFVS